MYCNKCGKVNPDDARFCSSCGYRFPEFKTEIPIPEAIQGVDSPKAAPATVIVEQQPVECPNCGNENPAGVRYCRECAEPMLKECAACRSWMKLDAEHCSVCGKSYQATQEESAVEQDRKARLRKSLLLYIVSSFLFIAISLSSIFLTRGSDNARRAINEMRNRMPASALYQSTQYEQLCKTFSDLQEAGWNLLILEFVPFSVGRRPSMWCKKGFASVHLIG